MSTAIANKKKFNTMFFIEMWERFAFYGFQTLFMLFITQQKLPSEEAYMVFGIFTALLYTSPVIGGLLSDRVIGLKRGLLLGSIILILGYFILSISVTMNMIIMALSLIAIGNGFFKPTPSAIVAKIYGQNATQSKVAFTYFYMSINIGSIPALTITPLVALYASYHLAFFLSVLGMIFGLSNYLFKRHIFDDINNEMDKAPFMITKWMIIFGIVVLLIVLFNVILHYVNISFYALLIFSVFIFCYLFLANKSSPSKSVKFKFYVGIILLLESIAFWVIYNQIFSTILMFADQHVNLYLLGLQLSPGNLIIAEGVAIIVLSPIIAKGYAILKRKNMKLTAPFQYAIGQVIAGASMLVLVVAGIFFSYQGKVDLYWVVSALVCFAIGEILISAFALSMVSLYFPKKMNAFCLGVFFLTVAIGGAVAGKLAALFVATSHQLTLEKSLTIYVEYFLWLGLISVGLGLLYLLIAIVIRRQAHRVQVDID
ncbi:peptide MFS transporter [uncultured Shewanella sp.]|uniref:peptide MFS transporter n=1 Tax=uncultured Shewanella sp. TaxID=173975 RepID=UPI002631A1A8|nr:peptide MFS transporter [uncultured Shewanella sp.]